MKKEWLGILRDETGSVFCPHCQQALEKYAVSRNGFPCSHCNHVFPLLSPTGEELALRDVGEFFQGRSTDSKPDSQ